MPSLPRLDLVKLGFAAAGIATFGVGIRLDDPRVRWVGVALVAVAWFLRFAAPKARPEVAGGQPPDETR